MSISGMNLKMLFLAVNGNFSDFGKSKSHLLLQSWQFFDSVNIPVIKRNFSTKKISFFFFLW